MFAITKSKRARLAYIQTVRRLIADMFKLSDRDATEQNQVWDEWLALKRQECRDLKGLVESDVKDVFKARAVAILLAPRIRFAPFAWSDDTSLDDYLFLSDSVALSKLSPQLLDFTLGLLEANIDVALQPDADEKLRETLPHYGRLILDALAILDENDPRAESLFRRYSLNDPIAFYSMDEASGYNPFLTIISSAIPEKWKKLSDDWMREVIRAEQEGRVQPRNGWEKALRNYMSHIQLGLYRECFPYSTDLFASQVEFALSLPNMAGRQLFSNHDVGKILRMFDGENRKELRHRLARHVMLVDHGEHGAFTVYDEEALSTATAILEEFGDADPELAGHLAKIIAKGSERIQENRNRVCEQESQFGRVMALMR